MTGIGRRALLRTVGAGAAASALTLPTGASRNADGPTVYVGSDGELYAIDPFSGDAVWTADDLSGFVWSSPTVVDGTVFVGTDGGTLLALDATTGTRRWTFTDPSARVSSSPSVVDGTVYVGSGDETLYAVSAETGDQVWSYAGPSGGTWSSPAVDDGTVYVGAEDDALHAVNARTGEREWVFTAPSGSVRSSPAVAAISPPDTFGDRTVYVGSMAGTLYAVDAATGDQVWSFTDPEESIFTSPAVVSGDESATVFVGSTDTALYAVDATTGEREWENTEPTQRLPSSPTVARFRDGDDTERTAVFFGTSTFPNEDPDGTVYAVDAASGTTLWTATEPAAAVESSPTVADVDGGLLFVGSDDGSLYALNPATGGLEWEFADASGQVHSSPTVVTNPSDGSGSGSRARLRVLGHHAHSPELPLAVTSSGPTASDGDAADAPDGGGDGVSTPTVVGVAGAGGAVTLLGAYAIRRALDGRGSATEQTSGSEPTADSVGGTATTAESVHTAAEQSRSSTSAADGTRERSPSAPAEVTAEGPPASVPPGPTASIRYDDLSKRERLGDGDDHVYRATTPEGTVVAVLEANQSGTLHTETVEEFVAGFETWSKLDDHDHIVGVVDYGSEPLPWVAMEYMDGGHLGRRVGTMALDHALWTAIATTRAVRYAHRRGVGHHCLRPSTVLFRSVEDAWDVPKVSDWGRPADAPPRSESGAATRYLAPEQLTDRIGPVTDRTDIYQLGVVCYELFTGQHPFPRETQEHLGDRLTGSPTSPSEVADVPPALDEVLLTAMATDGADRYETVVHFRDALQEIAESHGRV
jgi:outer membrane protein assembly factor BamB